MKKRQRKNRNQEQTAIIGLATAIITLIIELIRLFEQLNN